MLPLLAGLVLWGGPGRASGAEVDPRWRYVAELAPGAAFYASFSTGTAHVNSADTAVTPALRLTFLAPIGEDRHLGGSLWVDAAGHRSLLFGERLTSSFGDEPVTTYLDLQGFVDAWPLFAFGARVGAGGAYEVAKGWKLGAAFGLGGLVLHPRMVLDLAATVSYNF
jgi:hypothetical protein